MERQPYQRYTETFKLTVLNYYYEHGEDRKKTLLEFKQVEESYKGYAADPP